MKFERFNDTNLFLTDLNQEAISFAYYFSKDNVKLSPQSMLLEESWNRYLGVYIFLGKEVKKEEFENFSVVLDSFFSKQQVLEYTGVMWLEDYTKINQGIIPPPDRYSFCMFNPCICKQNAAVPCFEEEKNYAPIILYTKKVALNNSVQIESTSKISIGEYVIPVIENSGVELITTEEKLVISYPDIPGAQFPASGKGLIIPLSGPAQGAVQAEACIHDFSPYYQTGWDIGLRFNMYSETRLRSQFYPVFNLSGEQQVLFKMQWDPLRPLNAEKTFLLFAGFSFRLVQDKSNPHVFSIQPEANPTVIESFYKTIYGKTVLLKPRTDTSNPAKLVFQQYINEETEKLNYYIAPAGDFELQMPGNGGQVHKLLCGLSGTECFGFTAGDGAVHGDLLTFYPDKAAYTESYPVVTSGTEELLQMNCTVPWTMIKAGSNLSPIYYSMPESASLYKPSTETAVLDSYFAQTAIFTPEVSRDDTYCFPMVPYAGIVEEWPMDFNKTDIEPFERQIINYTRRKIISTIPIPVGAEADNEKIISTTPQGLLAAINGLNWEEILLAQSTSGLRMSFNPIADKKGIPEKLRSAFQTNEMFLVVSDNANLGTFHNSMTIENWQFNVKVPERKPENDPENKNIIVFKFRRGALVDLVQDSNYWTEPDSFNYNAQQVNSTQTFLVNYCNDAVSLAESDNSFRNFADIINNPDWFGILAFNVDIDLGNFPDDLKGLIAAMDLKRFRAHHFGIETSYVEQQGGSLKTDKTSLFGLISYIDKDYAKEENDPKNFNSVRSESKFSIADANMQESVYAYKVLKLQVLFSNSAVTNFNSKLQFTARQWFSEAASLTKAAKINEQKLPPNYSMFFNGHYENHDGHPTYTFLTEKNMEYLYYVDSKVINYLDFVKAQFSTSKSSDPQTDLNVEKISGVFSFTGYLNFRKVENFDLFSFGSEKEDQKQTGLYFSRLAVDVKFELDKSNNSTSDLTLNFNPVNAAFDPVHSLVRTNSLIACLPISPQSILCGNKQNMPAQQGFIHIKPPIDFKSSGLTDIWYGLNTDFQWGGPGSLADQTGFIPKILLAWSPGGEVHADILICLPGGGSSEKAISLQNVIKLKIGTFRFVKVENTEKTITSYNLLLNNIALNIMGLSFPPVGNTNLALLGNPEDPGTLGWYGAYKN